MKQYENEMQHALELYLNGSEEHDLHASEVAYLLKKIRSEDKEAFYLALSRLPQDSRGDVLLELPEKLKDEAITFYSTKELAEAVEGLESDDAADLVQDIDEVDEDKSEAVIAHLDDEDREEIAHLRHYEEDQAGAWMQIEVFDATLDETIQDARDRLKRMKELDEIENVHQVFIINDERRLIATIPLENVILFDFSKTFREQLESKEFRSVEVSSPIEEVASMFEQYDLSVLPVVDRQGHLVGRITSDDIYDVIEDRATEQIYNLAGVNDEAELEEDLFEVFKKRASWLLINLFTAILASIVIGMFDETLVAFVSLAILMPIVASMGGNAGTQTLTVMVRKMALGDIDVVNAKDAVIKEATVALLNGFIFAVLMGIVAYIWFDVPRLGLVIGLAMIFNLLIAGLFGAFIPLLLKRMNIDPAVGSSVLLTTATDVFGFLSFLGLASLILIK
ncbi:magnesium transporter [Sulfurimonas sp. HSL3-7]|uniref:magnesium transporter n=1 Tax=Sulfonitrofixus jiaomeiensis TaxID=3131938 RepID=UPI0031F75A2B